MVQAKPARKSRPASAEAFSFLDAPLTRSLTAAGIVATRQAIVAD